MLKKLINYKNPDIEFLVIDSLSDELYLEEGTDFVVIHDENSVDDIIKWAENQGFIDEYINEDSSLDFESLKSMKEEADLVEYNENPPIRATPSGRAFDWFQKLKILLPNGVSLVEGSHPGSDWRGVTITNINQLQPLQKFLFKKGFKVNFHLNFYYEED